MNINEASTTITNTSKYVHLIDKLLIIVQAKKYDKRLIQLYLCDLIDMDHHVYIKDPEISTVLLQNLCKTIQPTDSELIKLYCQYLSKLVKVGMNLNKTILSDCYRWIIASIENGDQFVINDLLLSLRNVINYGSFELGILEFEEFVSKDGLLQRLVRPASDRWTDTNFHALRCIECYLIKSTNEGNISSENIIAIKNVAMKTLCSLPQNNIDKGLFNKTAYLCLRILNIIMIRIEAGMWPDMTGEILGVIQSYLFHGIKGYSAIVPEFLRPAAMNLPEREQLAPKRSTYFQHRARERRVRAKKNGDTPIKNKTANCASNNERNNKVVRCSSDSETSDSETLSLNIADWKVQLKVVQLLALLNDTISSKELFGYWPQIIACSPESTNARVLTRFLLKVPDPTKKVRKLTLSVLAEVIEGARTFLLHAEEVEHTSFLPFFGMVSGMIKELHFALSLLLSNTKNFVVLTQALKCASALAQSTPYSRMKPGLATKLVRNCRVFLIHSGPTVKVATLLVFEVLASASPMTDEILDILEKSSTVDINSDLELNPSVIISEIEASQEEEEFVEFEMNELIIETEASSVENCQQKRMSSLLRVCLHNIARECVHDPVRIQSLRLLGTVASNAGQLISDHIELIAASLVTSMKSLEHQVALHSCRVIETISNCFTEAAFSQVNPFSFWNIVFEPTISLMQHTQTILREAACNCLSSMGAQTLSRLSRDKIILIITLLFAAVRDEESAVRAAGVRALGVLVSAPIMEEDAGFLMDLADVASLTTEDDNLGVRVKATWALASLCDTLLKRGDNPELEPVPFEIVMPKLFEASINAANDNNKVKSNAMRALGSIMSVCTGLDVLKDTREALDALISCATKGYDMKIRWNACHAIGLVLSRNPDQILPFSWKDEVFPVLSSLICDSPNFKVRINAAWAISVCTSFGKYIPSLWKNIILALENAQHVPNYVEYAHHDALVQQLCFAFCHVAIYTELSDLNIIWPDISEHIKDLGAFMKHFQLRVLPEKAGDLLCAKAQFKEFLQKASTAKEKVIAEALNELIKKSNVLLKDCLLQKKSSMELSSEPMELDGTSMEISGGPKVFSI